MCLSLDRAILPRFVLGCHFGKRLPNADFMVPTALMHRGELSPDTALVRRVAGL
ncbi:hypothetical protein [Acanthopleuribacter pedis]|uniref:Uncharacterized protein n=1 Tax=Acanthopleuribacter pedis TaxID=442870 RepID=A0A8J7U371_9BACT|nr:hypothetical protein [Acanthopleuribacter pedis]MBO1319322.1 hypothetical protein [Acanthopleuribacter pedis]